jgi:hypothetical protein
VIPGGSVASCEGDAAWAAGAGALAGARLSAGDPSSLTRGRMLRPRARRVLSGRSFGLLRSATTRARARGVRARARLSRLERRDPSLRATGRMTCASPTVLEGL